MKKLLMICGMLFSVVTFANAQGGRNMGTPEERATKMTTQLTEKLALTVDQQAKVKSILLDQNAAMAKTREEAGEDRKAARTKMMANMQESNAKINAVLTEDQKKAFAAYQEERKAAMQKRMGGRENN